MRLYHYTSTWHLPQIVTAGFLKLTDNCIDPDTSKEPYVCHFLDAPLSEVPGSHGLDGSIVDKTAVEFTVTVPDGWVRPWLGWARGQGINPVWEQVLVEAGGGMDAAQHWMVTFRTVPAARWDSVRVLRP